MAHPLEEIVPRKRRRRRAEHVGILHRRPTGSTAAINRGWVFQSTNEWHTNHMENFWAGPDFNLLCELMFGPDIEVGQYSSTI